MKQSTQVKRPMKPEAKDKLRGYIDQLQASSYQIAHFDSGSRATKRKRNEALWYLDKAVDMLLLTLVDDCAERAGVDEGTGVDASAAVIADCSEDMRSLGEQILHTRVEHGKTMRIAASELGVLTDKLSRFERGKTEPSEDEVKRIEEWLDFWN